MLKYKVYKICLFYALRILEGTGCTSTGRERANLVNSTIEFMNEATKDGSFKIADHTRGSAGMAKRLRKKKG